MKRNKMDDQKKKIIAISVLAFIVASAVTIIVVMAARGILPLDEVTESGFAFRKNNGGYTVVAYNGDDSCIEIPEKVRGLSVTAIDSGAFRCTTRLISVTVPDSVTSIGKEAFYLCPNLLDVVLPDSLTYVGENAFLGTSAYERAYDGMNGTYIGGYLMYVGNVGRNFSVADGTYGIAEKVFDRNPTLSGITFPSSMRFISQKLFSFCHCLTSATFASPSGWYVTLHDETTELSSDELSDASVAARYLTSAYVNYSWKKV